MTFEEKRKYKKLAKRYYIIAYIVSMSFMPLLVLSFLVSSKSFFWFIFPFIFIFVGLGIGLYAQHFLDFRIKYKADIGEFRERTKIVKVLDALRKDDYNTAVDQYNMLKSGPRKKFLYGYFIGMSLNSDVERKEKAEKIFNDIREDFNPDNVFTK